MTTCLRIAIPVPLRRAFDYLMPPEYSTQPPEPGVRIKVGFGRQTVIGVLLEVVSETDVPPHKLKPVIEILDAHPLLDAEMLKLLHWCSHYYQHPIGDVMQHALPVRLRQGSDTRIAPLTRWLVTAAGRDCDPASLQRAPRQAALLQSLQQQPQGLFADQLGQQHANWQPVMKRLQEKGWVTTVAENALPVGAGEAAPHALNPAQQQAVQRITDSFDRFCCHVLEGITGSGKTEVYLQAIQQVIDRGKQALVLVPEIGLTPQLQDRFLRRLNGRVALMHSGLNDEQRLQAWLHTRAGSADVIIGTRSAIFTPLLRPGIIVVDEEHDLSFKQQEGFRYSARDLAVKRGRDLQIPVVLGSATPSLETLYNLEQQRYQRLHLPERAGHAELPTIHLLDVRSQKMPDGLSAQLLHRMREHLDRGSQVLLFLNRRGYAPILMCHECGWHALCRRCDAHLTLHQHSARLHCHHCGAEQAKPAQCPECTSKDLLQMGYGTERIEQALQQHFADTPIVRIDRDSTRRKGSLQNMLQTINRGNPQILIGTQMLAKGHHFANVTLVAMLNADHGLYSADFRAAERMGQLLLQVAGRAGREEKKGEVLVQTHHPDHPLFRPLLQHDYTTFARQLLQEREQTELPPFTRLALLRAEAVNAELPMQFLQQARILLEQHNHMDAMLMGPFPALMERRAGRYRAQLLIQSNRQQPLQTLFHPVLPMLEQQPLASKVRWSLDMDPMDLM